MPYCGEIYSPHHLNTFTMGTSEGSVYPAVWRWAGWLRVSVCFLPVYRYIPEASRVKLPTAISPIKAMVNVFDFMVVGFFLGY